MRLLFTNTLTNLVSPKIYSKSQDKFTNGKRKRKMKEMPREKEMQSFVVKR